MSLSFILFSIGLCFILVVINPHYSRLGYLLQLIGVVRSFSYSLELSACFLGKYLWTSLSDYMIMSEFLNKWNRFKEDEDPLGIDRWYLAVNQWFSMLLLYTNSSFNYPRHLF